MREMMRLKNALALPLVYGLNEPAVEDNPNWPRYIRITDFNEDGCLNEDTFKSVPPHKASGAYLRKGDILLARSGATVGKAFCFNEEIKACFAGYLIRARLNNKRVLPQYFSYVTRSTYYSDWKNRTNIQTTIQNISAEKYNQFEFPCPSLIEQQRVVDYLDSKLSEIDKRVSVLEQQQDAYARLKKSIIHQAVTRGLNPDVRLKDSGIEWIGMIPEHWDRKRIKDVVLLTNEKTTDTSLPYIALENIVSWDARYIESEAETEGTNNVFKKGDVLFGKLRPYLAKGFIPTYDGICSSEFFVLRPKRFCYSRFLLYYILSAPLIDYIKNQVAGVKMPRTNWSSFGGLSIYLPSFEEQRAIANYLDEKCAKIDSAVENISKQIEASKRLKRAIINEAISGKTTI